MTGNAEPRIEIPVPLTVTGVNMLRLELGIMLRELRAQAGLSVAQAAEELDCHPSKISRLEGGQRGANPRDVRDLAKLYGTTEAVQEELMAMAREARQIDRSSNSTIFAKFTSYLAWEAKAVGLRTFESTLVPGLFQTERYARRIMADTADLTADEIEDRIRVRFARQRRLTASVRPLRVHAVVDENVLWRPLGRDPKAAADREAQLDQLVAMSRLPNVTIQVMPYDAGLYPGIEASTIILLDFGEDSDQDPAYYLEGMVMELNPQRANVIAQTLDRIQELALSPARSRALLMRVAGGRYQHWSMR